MFSPRTALGLTLASAACLTATGCNTETLGGSIVSPNGECISGKTWLELGAQQTVYLGGDLKVDGDHGVQDSLKLTNAGKGVLDVVRSSGDEGTVSFPDSGTEVEANPNESESTDFSLDLASGVMPPLVDAGGNVDNGDNPDVFRYNEDKATFVIDPSVQGADIEIQLTTTCAK